jgi:hypothetical protein
MHARGKAYLTPDEGKWWGMIYRISRRNIYKWAVVAAIALIVTRLFFVQELITALVIFSVLFACVAIAVLMVFLVDHAVQTVLDWAEAYVRAFGQAARRSRERVRKPMDAGQTLSESLNKF